jgi:hypothetical protein
MIEVLSVAITSSADHGPKLGGSMTLGARRPTPENLSSGFRRSERSDVAPPMYGKYNPIEPGALSITVRWTIVPPGFPIPAGRTLRPVFIVRPSWAPTCGCKSRHELVTVSEVKRNCVRATERGEEA